MVQKKAILDTSSAILLYKANLHTVTAQLYSLIMPPSVVDELTQNTHPGAETYRQLLQNKIITTAQVMEEIRTENETDTLTNLDRGEKDSIRLLLSGTGDFLITDDGAAAKYCRHAGIPFINALLIPIILRFVDREKADHWHSYSNRVMTIGRYSEWVINYAQNCSRSDLLQFLP